MLPELDLEVGQPQQYIIQRARWTAAALIERELQAPCVRTGVDEMICSSPETAASAFGFSRFARRLKPLCRLAGALAIFGRSANEIACVIGCSEAQVQEVLCSVCGSYRIWNYRNSPRSVLSASSRRRALAFERREAIQASEALRKSASLKGGG